MIKKDYFYIYSVKPIFEEAVADLCSQLQNFIGKVFKICIFIDSDNKADYIQKKHHISQAFTTCFNDELPAWSVLSEKPCNSIVRMELICSDAAKQFLIHQNRPFVVLNSEEERELWASGFGDNEEGNIEEVSNKAFEDMLSLLKEQNFTLDEVVRQWNYIGQILHIEQTPKGAIQNYQAFNDIRNKYYNTYKKNSGYPAATGIGMKTPGLVIDFFAQKNQTTLSFPVQSSVQENPFDYTEDVLIGEAIDCTNKKPPLFERARMLVSKSFAQIFVSGTASIKNQQTIAIGDIEQQTKNTIGFIENLVSFDNLRKSYSDFKFKHKIYQRVRVYVKRRDDLEIVKQICEAFYPEDCLTIVEADVCRDNLLVEIEADLLFN